MEHNITSNVHNKTVFSISGNKCFICNSENGPYKNFKNNHIEKKNFDNNFMRSIIKCFNIHVISPRHHIRNMKFCRECVRRLREALSFREVVRLARERLHKKINSLFSNIPEIVKIEVPEYTSKAKLKGIPTSRVNSNKEFKRGTLQKNVKHSNISKDKVQQIKEEVYDPDQVIKIEYPFGSYCDTKVKTTDSVDDITDYQDDNTGDHRGNSSDGDSSTTSEQMKRATGKIYLGPKKLALSSLDPSCNTCPTCKKTFPKFVQLQHHYNTTHLIRFLCDICGLSYTKKTYYTNHMSTAHSGIVYTCELCKKTFKDKSNLNTHVRTFHMKEKLHSCHKCEEKFSNFVTRRRHLYLKHGEEVTQFQCTICGRVFFSKCGMRNHVRRTHDKIKKFSCNLCDLDFYTKAEIKEHMIVHLGTKDFACTVCGKTYARKKTLTEHLKIHANIRNYKCEVCEKSFIQKCSLKSHMNTHFKNY